MTDLKHDYSARKEAEALSAKIESLSAPFGPLGDNSTMTVTTAPYTKYKGDPERKLPFPELIAVFGADVVRDYLRVALYAGAVEYLDVKRSDMIKALEILNKALNPEVKFND